MDARHSVVLECDVYSINPTDDYPTQITLRWHRIKRIRWDKPWHDALTFSECKALSNTSKMFGHPLPKRALSSRHDAQSHTSPTTSARTPTRNPSWMIADDAADGSDSVESAGIISPAYSTPRRLGKRTLSTVPGAGTNTRSPKQPRSSTKKSPAIVSMFSPTNLSAVQRKSDLLAEYELCVLGVHTVEELTQYKTMIVGHGGTVVANPIAERTKAVLTSRPEILRIQRLCDTGDFTVLHIQWLLDCIQLQQVQDIVGSRHLLKLSEHVEQTMREKVDAYGDRYTDDATLETLADALDKACERHNALHGSQQKLHSRLQLLTMVDADCKLWDYSSAIEHSNIIEVEDATDLTTECSRLSNVRAYFMVSSGSLSPEQDNAQRLASMLLQLHGATVEMKLNVEVTHILCDAAEGTLAISRVAGQLRELYKAARLSLYDIMLPVFVSLQWPEQVVEDRTLMRSSDLNVTFVELLEIYDQRPTDTEAILVADDDDDTAVTTNTPMIVKSKSRVEQPLARHFSGGMQAGIMPGADDDKENLVRRDSSIPLSLPSLESATQPATPSRAASNGKVLHRTSSNHHTQPQLL